MSDPFAGGTPRPAAAAEARTIQLLEILAEQGAETNRLLADIANHLQDQRAEKEAVQAHLERLRGV